MPFYRNLLWPFAAVYGVVVWFRNRLFDWGILSSKRFDVPVICVGNLEAGGTGKSPVVLHIIELLLNSGKKPVLLSRGYGRKTKGYRLVQAGDAAADVGDEPLQAKLRFPEIPVVVCENRVTAVERIKSELDVDVVVMDDGFQHRWVKPSLTVLVTRSEFPFWRNQLLPVGTLREARSEVKRADVVLQIGYNAIRESSDLSIFNANTFTGDLIQFSGSQLSIEKVKNVVLFSGIANSERFEISASVTLNVLHHEKFSDHHNYTVAELNLLQKKINSFGTSVDALVTTEKDAARLRNQKLLNELDNTPVFYLPLKLEFDKSQKQEFEKLILDNGEYA